MPAKHYTERLSHREIIKLVDSGRYIVDLEKGVILQGKTKVPLFTYTGSEQEGKDNADYLWVRLYKSPAYRCLPVAHVIWIMGTRSPVPRGFEIHHMDEDRQNNAFLNLYALHKVDHRKWHAGNELSKTQVPF